MPLTPSDQAERCAAGLHAHWRAQCGYVTGGEVAEHGGLLAALTNLPDQTLNVAFAPGPVARPAEALDWFEELFRSRGFKPAIEVRVGRQPEVERLLAERGYAVVVRRPAMALHPVAVAEAAAPRVRVRRVADDADLAAFHAIQGEVFDLAPGIAEEFLPRRAVETPGIAFLLAWHDDVPCATASVSVSEHGAGIVGVGTLPAYRRRGIGRAVTAAAIRAAGDVDLAWLYPSPVARRLYEGLGFRALDDTQVWVRT